MKKITKGNDFTMRIPVCKMEGGEQIPYPLPACTDIVVNLVNAFRRRPLSFTIDVAHDNIILAKVEDNLPCATYALEVKGKCLGNDWRSNEYEQIKIVDNNASADYNFSELQEGENSVDMNTAIIILAPSVELSGLITDTENALKKVDETIADTKRKTEEAVNRANTAKTETEKATSYANTQADRAKALADHPNKVGEDGYWYAWDETSQEYVKTDFFAKGGCDFPTFAIDYSDMSLNVALTADTDKERYFIDQDGCLCVKHNPLPAETE